LSRIPLPSAHAVGGSTILTSQSQCPFKAFATARLNAHGWEPAQPGLTAIQRGQLLHSVLHSVWSGKLEGISTHKDLAAISDLPSFVERHVRQAQSHPIYLAACKFMPHRYLDLEVVRLARLVTEWLEYERTRAAFTVTRTELDTNAAVAGLELRLRMDRIDRLNDGSLLVIDYKSGDVSPSLWDLPRPDDVQVPLYVGFALSEQLREIIARESEEDASGDEAAASDGPAGRIGGLVFAKVRPGDVCFAGRVGDAQATLLPGLGARSALVQNPFSAEDLIAWRDYIEQMATDFVAGRAAVDPRSPDTCKYCDLQSLCRIQELQPNIQDLRPNEEELEDD
jgi:ATP-dependent helicase/DNAse subunit B